MKKMYKKPITEVNDLKAANLMQGLVVSFGGNNGGSTPPVGAPHRGTPIPY
jgi:hypothetical protein